MAKSSQGGSVANRQEKREQAQAAALYELEVLAERKRRQTNKLRKLRLQQGEADAYSFRKWRERKSSTGEN